ncbi:glycine oxidase ThiO [Phytohalomonas tamaricis]|uniref:glycine oxidase ThiO n=1 Tax=Phytohalomonas tamaricis TaxID=2081032 RepID=UPI000D0AEC4E|nr:glycine oxidase ThiO [Phytohalomonas tamaricis]
MDDFLIVGGGVIGMMSALRLAEAGASVTLVERQRCAHEASWAGGGIVSPLYPWRYDAPVTALASYAEQFYPQLAEQLAAATGIDPQFTPGGIFYLRVEDVASAKAWASAFDKRLETASPALLETKLSQLTASSYPALWMPDLGSIRTPRLGKALRERLKQLDHVTLVEHTEVYRVHVNAGTALGVETSQGLIEGGHVVVAGGAWSARIIEPLGSVLPIYPVKGQMLLFKAAPGLLEHVVLMNGHYLIPRRDGLILAGSTFEDVGFDKSLPEEGYRQLYAQALEILPELKHCEVVQHWAGLRPGTPGSIPFIGALPEVARLSINAGHFGNGVMMAPAAGQLLADLLLGNVPIVDPAPYQPKNATSERLL